MEWFLEEYIKDEEISPCNYITIQEIFTRIKESEKYKTLSPQENKNINKEV